MPRVHIFTAMTLTGRVASPYLITYHENLRGMWMPRVDIFTATAFEEVEWLDLRPNVSRPRVRKSGTLRHCSVT